MPATKDIWARTFLDATDGDSSSDDDCPDATAPDAGELERQQLEQIDLSSRDEGTLVIRHNPW